MGTRADFYVNRGPRAEWLGSIAWDGDAIPDAVLDAKTEQTYRKAVKAFLASREDGTTPAMGWPWPWNDSRTTDYAYAFSRGEVRISCFGHAWYRPGEESTEGPKVARFPNMARRKRVTLGKRSGVMVISAGKVR